MTHIKQTNKQKIIFLSVPKFQNCQKQYSEPKTKKNKISLISHSHQVIRFENERLFTDLNGLGPVLKEHTPPLTLPNDRNGTVIATPAGCGVAAYLDARRPVSPAAHNAGEPRRRRRRGRRRRRRRRRRRVGR